MSIDPSNIHLGIGSKREAASFLKVSTTTLASGETLSIEGFTLESLLQNQKVSFTLAGRKLQFYVGKNTPFYQRLSDLKHSSKGISDLYLTAAKELIYKNITTMLAIKGVADPIIRAKFEKETETFTFLSGSGTRLETPKYISDDKSLPKRRTAADQLKYIGSTEKMEKILKKLQELNTPSSDTDSLRASSETHTFDRSGFEGDDAEASAKTPFLTRVKEKFSRLFFREKQKEIYHLGASPVPKVFFPSGSTQIKQDDRTYFYERIAISTKEGEVHLFRNTLKPYVKRWMEETKKGRTKAPFQKWMEAQEDLDRVSKEKVRYLSSKDLKQTEVRIQDGKMLQEGLDSKDEGELKPLAEGSHAFILYALPDESGNISYKMHSALKEKTEKGKIQHSSFLHGQDVVSAGMLEVDKDGKITRIKNQSGHYKPSAKELAHFLKYLKDSGFDCKTIYVDVESHFEFLLKTLNIYLKKATTSMRADRWFEASGKHLL